MKIIFFESDDMLKSCYEKSSLSAYNLVFEQRPLIEENVANFTDAKIISVGIRSHVDRAVLEKLPNLQFISARSTGCDHIDCEFARQHSVEVVSVPGYSTNSVAEYTFGLLLTLVRKIQWASHAWFEDEFFDRSLIIGSELSGKTLGVVGTGNIGKEVIKRAVAFNMNIIAYDINPDERFAKELGFEYQTLEYLLSQADIVTLHIPSTPETYEIIDEAALRLMKKDAFIINTARGALIDIKALVQALLSDHLQGAAVDVLEYENLMYDPRILVKEKVPRDALDKILFNRIFVGLPNVIATPHCAYLTHEAVDRVLKESLKHIERYVQDSVLRPS